MSYVSSESDLEEKQPMTNMSTEVVMRTMSTDMPCASGTIWEWAGPVTVSPMPSTNIKQPELAQGTGLSQIVVRLVLIDSPSPHSASVPVQS